MANKPTKSTKSTRSTSAKRMPLKSQVSKPTVTKTSVSRSSKSPTKKSASIQASSLSTPSKRAPFKLNRTYFMIGLIVLLLAGLLWVFRGLFVAATVNGQPISRLSVVKELEKQGGKQTLNSLITKQLIMQEAAKRNIAVSEDEIAKEIKKIEDNFKKQGQKLDDVIKTQNITREGLKEQIKVQKLIEKMLSKDITVSDKEVTDYLTQNKENLPETTKPDEIKEQLKQQKLNDKFQAFLADLQQKARIRNFVSY